MQKINFQNLPSTTTPVNATNLNTIQTNTENAINIFDLYNDTSGSDWQTMMKNKIDYCIANMDNSKTNTTAFINGGWSTVNYGTGICSKIGSNYILFWYAKFQTPEIYFCRFDGTNYEYSKGSSVDDTGWVDLTLQNGVTARDNTPAYKPQFRRIGNIVYLKGQVDIPSHTGDLLIATIPSGYLPSYEAKMPSLDVGNWIDTSGNITVQQSGSLSYQALNTSWLIN